MRSSLTLGFFAVLIALSSFVDGGRLAEESLRFAAIIHRHGDRSPCGWYPNDPHLNHKWPGGLGALTKKGSLEMYMLGKNLRSRYSSILPADGDYTPDKIHAMSSSVERTQMSGQSFFAGFLPPQNNRNALPILWQPVPIHTIPLNEDNLITQDKPCPRYDQVFWKILADPPLELNHTYQKHEKLRSYLNKHSGLNESIIRVVGVLWDVFTVQREHSLELPAWAIPVFPDKMRPIAELGLTIRSHTKYMKLVKAAPLVTKITDQMLKYQSGNSSKSVYVYSGHDITLLSVMRLLELEDQTTQIPEYGATLAFELHCDREDACGQLEVRIVYYSNFKGKNPRILSIPNCPAPCMLNRFAESIKYVLDFNYADGCELNQKDLTSKLEVFRTFLD